VAYLDRTHDAALGRLLQLNPRLVGTPDGVRNSGAQWFWGVAFSPMPEVYSDAVAPAVDDLVASAVHKGLSGRDLARSILVAGPVLREPRCRDGALRLLFALGVEDPRPYEFVDRFLARHPDGGVRSVCVGLLALHADQEWARRRLARLTHDVDDRVFLRAFRAIGALRLGSALPDLFHIILSASSLVEMARHGRSANPVGLGGAHGLVAILQVMGTDDPERIRAVEREVPKSAALASQQYESLSQIARTRPGTVEIPPAVDRLDLDMVVVPGGTVPVGLAPAEAAGGQFRHTNVPRRSVALDSFRIARDPVTNAVYDAFVDEFGRRGGRDYEHPLQPAGKEHTRATVGDPRFGPDHPVCGVDWFDAFAFCAFYGLRLPGEDEWEWAATGPDPRPPGRNVHGFDAVYGRPRGLLDWSRRLNETGARYPRTTTVSVADAPVHGFGLRHALGNVWEYTDTNWCTRGSMLRGLPELSLTPEQYMSLHPYHVVIKGGAWTSVGNLLEPAYRGLDLFSDRHCEIGFRVAERGAGE
jgi:formylglycine-generating enzyme required for sulfatase activity